HRTLFRQFICCPVSYRFLRRRSMVRETDPRPDSARKLIQRPAAVSSPVFGLSFPDVPPDVEVALPDCWLPEPPAVPVVPVPPAVVLSPFSGRPSAPFSEVSAGSLSITVSSCDISSEASASAKYLPQSSQYQ